MATWKEGQPITTIRKPHTARPRIEGTSVSSRIKSGERFREFPLPNQDLSLLTEPTVTDFIAPPQEVLESLTKAAVLLRDASEEEGIAREKREAAKEEIMPVIKGNPGLRGLVSEQKDVRLTATPAQSAVVFDADLLRRSVRTQKRFRKLTSKRVMIEVTPRKDMAPEVLRTIIEEGLNSLGARVARRASVTTELVVDDAAVAEMVRSGEITLLPGTRVVTEGFNLKAERSGKRRKKIIRRRTP